MTPTCSFRGSESSIWIIPTQEQRIIFATRAPMSVRTLSKSSGRLLPARARVPEKLRHSKRLTLARFTSPSNAVTRNTLLTLTRNPFRGKAKKRQTRCLVEKKTLIGRKIRAARVSLGFTQEELAELIDRSVETVSNLERGKTLPNHATLERIGVRLGISVAQLLEQGGTEPSDDERNTLIHRVSVLIRGLPVEDLRLALAVLKAIASKGRRPAHRGTRP
jgi:transcriptional regulator with XRE-family HTH domain